MFILNVFGFAFFAMLIARCFFVYISGKILNKKFKKRKALNKKDIIILVILLLVFMGCIFWQIRTVEQKSRTKINYQERI